MNLAKLKIEPIYEYIDVNIIKSIPKFEDIEKVIFKYGKHLISKNYNKFTTEEKILSLCCTANVLAKQNSSFYYYKNILLIYFSSLPYYNSRKIGIGTDDYGEEILYVDPPTGPQLSFHIKNSYILDLLLNKFGKYEKDWSGKINYKNPIYKFKRSLSDMNYNYFLWENFNNTKKVDIIFPGLKQILRKFTDKIITIEVRPDTSWSKMSSKASMIINHYILKSNGYDFQWGNFCDYLMTRMDSFTGLYEITSKEIKTPFIDVYTNELVYTG